MINFSKAAKIYDKHAFVQKTSSDYLAEICKSILPISPKSILDIGCGTGFTSLALKKFYTESKYTLCDISKEMIEVAKNKIENCKCIPHNAESYEFKSGYDLVVSNLAFQWFNNLDAFLGKILHKCKHMSFSILLKNSFEDYKNLFKNKGVNILTNDCLSENEIYNLSKGHGNVLFFCSKEYDMSFDDAISAARYFKNIGANITSSKYNQGRVSAILTSHRTQMNLKHRIFFAFMEGKT
ncbi:MAG: methyltransferase domain-containing protein [Holosporales bacterium]|jgi:malonyl-CoA O-methyltransferase|nr:methyltransferase domain-containing protein [Holosporales bacterium]